MTGLIGFGLVLIYSASVSGQDLRGLDHPTVRQGVYAVVGLSLMLAMVAFDYRVLARIAPALYILMIASLGSVLIVGREMYGARRWIELPFFQFQPSEIAKLLSIVVLAKFLADREHEAGSFKTFVLSILIILPPMALVFLQPDLGTMIVLAFIWLGMVVMGGVGLKYLLGIAVIVLISLPKIYDFLLHGYMKERIDTFLNPYANPTGAGYNIIQAEIAVGSGGLFGQGWMNGIQVQKNFLRVQNTDFIFSVLGEEFGFVGGVLLFSLFVLLLFRALGTAGGSRDSFGRLMVCGIVVTILIQSFVNIGVNIRMLPVTGIPLPFVSFGGTALLTFMMALGLVQSVNARRSRSV